MDGDDTATEPLIASHQSEANDAQTADEVAAAAAEDGNGVDRVDESELGSPGVFIWGLTICAGVSGVLFGYDTGIVSSMLVSVSTDLSGRSLTTMEKSLVTSCTSFFALFASPLTGVLADQFGRKKVILGADVLFLVGAIWQARASSVVGMMIGRSVVGVAIGSASFVSALYIGELSPGKFRGRLVVVGTLLITAGQVIAYVVGWLFSSRQHGWRWMVGLGALPAVLQLLLLLFLPETPRYLAKVNRKSQARGVLKRMYGNSRDAAGLANEVLRRIEGEILEEEEATGLRAVALTSKPGWRARIEKIQNNSSRLVTIDANRRALIIACMLQGFQQLCGFNSLMYFSATVFSLVGFRSPILTSLSIAITNFLFTLVAFAFIDRVGRRRILLWSIPIMVAGLVLCAAAFAFVDLPREKASLMAAGADGKGKTWPLIILIAMVTFVAGYAIGMGNVPWQQSELFPLSVRSLGSAMATATNWGCNTLTGLTFLPMMEFFTPTWTFMLYACVCLISWVAVWAIYPETAGLSLEDVGGLLKNGYGVRESVHRFKNRQRDAR